MQDTEQWPQPASLRLEVEDLKRDMADQQRQMVSVQEWRIAHMTECHPRILYRLALIIGGVVGASGVLGFVLGIIYQSWGK